MITANDITLKMTCGACPEQYDAYLNELLVGYLRLRHGYFKVTCPWVGGEIVYEDSPEGDGIFEDSERERYLTVSKEAIAEWCNKQYNGNQ